MDIKKITANSKEDAGSDTYELLKMVHAMAAKHPDFEIKETATYTSDDYCLTVWTNGIVDISAESIKGVHTYTYEAC